MDKARKDFCYRDVIPQHFTISNFSICKTKTFENLATLDVTKTRGPDGLPPLFFRKTTTEMCKTLNTMFKAVKRNRKLPKAWKIAAVSPIHKNGERKLVENYRRPVSLLNIESNIFEKCIYEELSAHFTKFCSSKQHGFVPQRSL